jgi:hypothetical protein
VRGPHDEQPRPVAFGGVDQTTRRRLGDDGLAPQLVGSRRRSELPLGGDPQLSSGRAVADIHGRKAVRIDTGDHKLGVQCGAQQPAERERVVRLVAAVVADDQRAAHQRVPKPLNGGERLASRRRRTPLHALEVLDMHVRARIEAAHVTVLPADEKGWAAVIAERLEDLGILRRLPDVVGVDHEPVAWLGAHPRVS